MDLFAEAVKIGLPPLVEVKGRVFRAAIEKRLAGRAEHDVFLAPFAARGLRGFSGVVPPLGRLHFLPRATTTVPPGERSLIVPDFVTEAELSQRSRAGDIVWGARATRKPAEMTIEEAGTVCARVRASWKNAFIFRQEIRDEAGRVTQKGLRMPQLGALYATLAHWSVSRQPATIVMPTGTGKTETMLALLAATDIERLMIVVPNANLRDQIADKFLGFGILHDAGVLAPTAETPMVAVLDGRPKSPDEVSEIFGRANVIVTTMQVAGQCAPEVQARMAELCSHLFIDEAHHIAARTWQAFKGKFDARTVVQFTATPFRTDGRRVDGKFIYVYPLGKAQEEGYFRPINFRAVQGLDEGQADREIIRLVGEQLASDLAANLDHLVMARARDIKRATALHALYSDHLSAYSPVLIHSQMGTAERDAALARMRSRQSRIIICVDMLGEGFDLPQLKISGLHDRHKSVAITLQFTGRFTRDAKNIGEATVIANIEQSDVDDSLRTLYAEDADWNFLLKVLSEAKTGRQLKRAELLQGFAETLEGVPLQTLIPKMSTVVYRTACEEWKPYNAFEGLPPFALNAGPTVNEGVRLAIFVTREEIPVRWSAVKEITNVEWNLYLVHWDKDEQLLYINSSRSNDLHERLAKALCGEKATRIAGEPVYRVLDGINRLILMNLGLSSLLGRKIRYTMFAGSDIAAQLTDAQNSGKRKSNLFGVGFNGQGRRTIGCSAKGKFWALESAADFSEWVEWCRDIGRKVTDDSIATDGFLRNLVKQEQLTARPPGKVPLTIFWPEEFLIELEERLQLRFGGADPVGFYECEIELVAREPDGPIHFKICSDDVEATFAIDIGKDGASYPQIGGPPVSLVRGKERPLTEIFGEDPPQLLFADGDFLIFNELFKVPREADRRVYDDRKIEARDWTNIDLSVESQGLAKKPHSIQRRIIEWLLEDDSWDVIFDDDGSGEIADIVALRERGDCLEVHLYHIKYAHGAAPGNRVADLYEVCGQAQKSVRWMEYPARILKRIRRREKDRSEAGKPSRFERGGNDDIRHWLSRWQLMDREYAVWIVQPGLRTSTIEPQQLDLLAATENYLLDTYSAPLRVIASA
ncbi:Superfamily II DNA or RNA helicase [Sphingopyxis sp. YR583]|uniref:DEAD/DEAH box helicase n=1 Tax=Sphingopyxis sp. YR583 TaxID=1881047 RepID=UPI0008A7E407|nr:DEAD/DEAH box helicase family protein [Sphingopyxis sp. YR583]SEH12689.1 Superfamily II DNA or RNA helicase [Sphingopyxis sp. YR583]